MTRIMVGGAVALLMTTGAFIFWQGHAESRSTLPNAPSAVERPANGRLFAMAASPELPGPPEASPATREQKRFLRADKDQGGKITEEELLMPRRKAFAKLDANHDGMLSFNEWAARTIAKLDGADDDHSGSLTAAEYAETAPKARKHPRCSG